MTFDQVVNIIRNLGVPVGILIWLLWRADFFLRYLVHKLDKFNDELYMINLSLRDLVNQLKK